MCAHWKSVILRANRTGLLTFVMEAAAQGSKHSSPTRDDLGPRPHSLKAKARQPPRESRFFAFSSSSLPAGEGPAVAKAYLAPPLAWGARRGRGFSNDGISWRVFTFFKLGVAVSATSARTLRSEARARRLRRRLRRRPEGAAEPSDHRARPAASDSAPRN